MEDFTTIVSLLNSYVIAHSHSLRQADNISYSLQYESLFPLPATVAAPFPQSKLSDN